MTNAGKRPSVEEAFDTLLQASLEMFGRTGRGEEAERTLTGLVLLKSKMNQYELSCFDRLLKERLELAIQDFQEMDGFDPKRPLLDFYNRSMKLIIICGLAMGSEDALLAIKALQALENASRETKAYILKVIPSLRAGAASPVVKFLSETQN